MTAGAPHSLHSSLCATRIHTRADSRDPSGSAGQGTNTCSPLSTRYLSRLPSRLISTSYAVCS